ncbi:MAG: SIS domain-containing protein [Verrucomicrobiota bacterium]|jgi:D-sedoheptulose 7-phosphate isomerase|nr:SIS domain-containing protein [Verrucomicrobiota bacterium]MDD8045238.1 SIS domain-containing protein [Verrucomicrobiota bacterium]MDD8050548.1 SIS domain-containing protein [Verrucomicrobiota bacterium]
MDLREYLDMMADAVRRIDMRPVHELVDVIEAAYREGRTVFLVGNGGSGANASHFCEDLGKGTLSDFENQRRLRVISLTDNTPYILAWGNDEGFDRVFVEQLKNLAVAGDVLIGISCSGNSPNVVKAMEWAKAHQIYTFAFTDSKGGKLGAIADQMMLAPSTDVGDAEALHGIVIHYVVHELYERFKQI